MDVQGILKQLEMNAGMFPREAVAQALEPREAITPELLRLLDYAHRNIEHLNETGISRKNRRSSRDGPYIQNSREKLLGYVARGRLLNW